MNWTKEKPTEPDKAYWYCDIAGEVEAGSTKINDGKGKGKLYFGSGDVYGAVEELDGLWWPIDAEMPKPPENKIAPSDDEEEEWGGELYATWRCASPTSCEGWVDLHPSRRAFWCKVALRFRARCVGPYDKVVAAARRFIWWRVNGGGSWMIGDAILVSVRNALCALPDQGDPPDDPGYDAIRGRLARVDDNGQVETGMESSRDPAANGYCPCFNDHDGSCMYGEGLEQCLSGKPGWAEKDCPAMNSAKLETRA